MSDVSKLLEIMARLRDPEGGCVWDLAQRFETIAPYTIEEAYEVDDAIRSGDRKALCDELGDLLLQVVFHARMAEEEGAFAFSDVVDAICDKLVRRHPNVFGDAVVTSKEEQAERWEAQKAAERSQGGSRKDDGVPLGLPALTRARKIVGRARRAGFRWDDPRQGLAKLDEELGELREAVESGDPMEIEAELGDVLFVGAGVGNDFSIDPESALRGAIGRFESRFRRVEELAGGGSLEDRSLEELLRFWGQAKTEERG